MDNYNVKQNFSEYSDAELIDRANNVVTQMTGNIHFVNPEPPLAEITTATDNFSAAYFQVYNRNLSFMAEKRMYKSILIKLLKREASYVEFIGQNVESVIDTSGFEIYSTAPTTAPASDIPVIKKAKDTGISGTSKLRVKKVKHAVVYELRHTKDVDLNTANWVHLVCQTQIQFEVTNLIPGTEYFFEARSISTKGPSGWSNPFRFRAK